MTKIGILSTANINYNAIIRPSRRLKNIELYGVASRDYNRAKDYAQKYKFTKAFQSYDDLVNDKLVDLVYISLPNSMHAEWIIKCIEAGKHVLCEKPLALSMEEIDKISKAMRSDIMVMEALHYSYHPLMIKAKEMIAQNQLGEITSVKLAFHRNPPSKNDIRLNPNLGGGCVWDVGIYCVDAIRFLFNTNAVSITSSTFKKNEKEIPTQAIAQFLINNRISGSMECSFRSLSRYIKIEGTAGNLFIFNPFTHNGWLYLFKHKDTGKFWNRLNFFDTSSTYFHQLKYVLNLLVEKKNTQQNNVNNSSENIRLIEEMLEFEVSRNDN